MTTTLQPTAAAPAAIVAPQPAAASKPAETVSFTELFRRNVGQSAAHGAARPAEPAPPPIPTVQSEFGDHPWLENPGGTGPLGDYRFNPVYFATPEAAQKVAEMMGGKAVACNNILGPGAFSQLQPNQMVEMPDGKLINAGLVINFFSHGYPKWAVDAMIANEISGGTKA